MRIICKFILYRGIDCYFEIYPITSMAVKLYSLASFGEDREDAKYGSVKVFTLSQQHTVMLFYDIIITFGDEVEYIWKKKFTPFTTLWFLVCPSFLTKIY